jgi:amino acid transporter
LNAVIGSGIFLLPGLLAAQSGPGCLLAYLGAGLICFLVALCFAEVGGLFTHSGGSYVYAREAFGDTIGFLVGWMSWLARVATWAAVAVAFTRYLSYFWPGADGVFQSRLIVLALLAGLTLVNHFGVRQAAWLINIFTVGKLLPLFLFVGAGLFFINPSNFRPFLPHGLEPVWLSTYTVLFAYAGFEVIPIPSEEVRDPRRNVPLAVLIVILFVTVFYILIQSVGIGTLPGLAASKKPLADAAAAFLGPRGGTIIALGAIISILGINAATCLIGPRCLYAMAEDGLLPPFLARLHPRFGTPSWGLAITLAAALALSMAGSFEKIVLISVLGKLAMYLPTCLAVPILRKKMPDAPRRFRVPGGIFIPVLACLVLLVIFLAAPAEEKIAGGVALLIGAVLNLVLNSRRAG